MNPNESVKQRLERYQRTQDLTKEIKFSRESLPYSKTTEGAAPENASQTSKFRTTQVQAAIDRTDMGFIRSYIQTLGELDPANPYYTNLLNRTFIPWDEFQTIVENFSTNQSYLVRMQDEINNLRLAAAQEGEIETGEAETVVEQTPPDQTQNQEEEVQPQQNQGEEQGQPSPGGQAQQSSPRYVLQRRMTKEEYAKYKEANKALRDEQAAKLWDQRRKSRMTSEEWARYKGENKEERDKRAKKLWEDRKKNALLRKPGTSSGWNPLGDWGMKKIGQKIGEKIAQSKAGQAFARNFADPLKQALQNSRAWQAIAPRIQPLIDAYNTVAAPFRAVSNWLGGPSRWLDAKTADLASWAGNGIKSGAIQGARAIGNQIGNLFNWVRNNPFTAMEIPAGVTAGWASITAAVAGISLGVWVAIIVVVSSFIFYIWSVFDANSECGKPGVPQIIKSVNNGTDDGQGNKIFREGEEIEYKIQIVYKLKCVGLVDVDVKDTIDTAKTTYVEGSAKDDIYIESRELLGTSYERGRDGNTLFWKIKSLPNSYPITLSFKITPNQTDTWIANEAQATFKAYGRFGETTTSGGGFPPTQDNCNGKWELKNPIGNYGDPNCDFEEDKLSALLQQLDPANAAYWFNVVVRGETGGTFDPNIWADPVKVGTPDAAGAWGLFQMGRGKNGQYDHGDVDWQLQTSNAINYNNNLATPWCYWKVAETTRWTAGCYK